MTPQEYLEQTIEQFSSFTKVRNNKIKEIDELFRSKGAKEQNDVSKILSNGSLTEEDLNKYYSLSVISNDVTTIAEKLADYIHFSKVLNVELNLEPISKIHGFTEYMKDYQPYATNYKITPEEEIKETNPELFERGREAFKKTLQTPSIVNLVNEARNENPS